MPGYSQTPLAQKLGIREGATLTVIRPPLAYAEWLAPRLAVGVGNFAEAALRRALGEALPIARIPHPSPASPAANRGWARQAESALAAAGVSLP